MATMIMSDKQKNKKNDTVLALCIQEISEDGSELNIGDNFSTEDVRFLHQAFIADTLVNILGISTIDVHLFYGVYRLPVMPIPKLGIP